MSMLTEIRFKNGNKMVLTKERWNSIRGYKHPIQVLGKTINPQEIISHDYFEGQDF